MFVWYHIVGYADDLDSVFIDFESCLFKRFASAEIFKGLMKMHLASGHRSCSFAVEFGAGFDWVDMPLAEKDFSVSEDHDAEADSYISIFCHALSWYVKGLCVFTRTSASDKFDLLSELSYER